MDQLAPVIKWLKKNVFWLTCAFLAVAMIGIWFYSSTALAKVTKKKTVAIKKVITTAKGIMNVKPEDITEGGAHPNSVTEEGMKAELAATIDSIVDAWTIRKTAQDKILVWPSVIPNDAFVSFFGEYDPPETFPEKYNTGVEVAPLLELYRAKIPEHMIYLCGEKLLRTRWNFDPANGFEVPAAGIDDDGGFGSGGGGGRGASGGFGSIGGGGGLAGEDEVDAIDLNKYAVIWSDTNQTLWYQKLTTFQGRDDNGRETNDPTPLQCYMLQQDLWLLEAMFQIIRDVNGNSNANDLSVIKNIDHVVFGREVGEKLGELIPADQRLAGRAPKSASMGIGGRGGDEGDDSDGPDTGGFGGRDLGQAIGGGDADAGPASNKPYHNRYVDVNYEPIGADVVTSVITGEELPEENLELIVAKRVPVRIAVKMDERKIPDFMAACANSPFAFEIQQVRWNKHPPGGEVIALGGSAGGGMMGGMGGGMGARGGGDGMGMGDMGGMQGMGGGLGGGGLGGSPAVSIDSTPVEKRINYDVNVEFYGIVKIYNNPSRGGETRLRKAAGLIEGDELTPADAANPTP